MSTYYTIESLGIKALERPASERGTFPRYRVAVDSETYEPKTPRALRKLLSVIRTDRRPEVFRNAGKGITINFDI